MNRREVQAVAETTAGIHVMFIDVLDDDGASAVGQVFLDKFFYRHRVSLPDEVTKVKLWDEIRKPGL